MNFDMIPAPKRVKVFEGIFQFDALRIFTVGEGEPFGRTLKALLPEGTLLKLKGNPLAEAYAEIARQAAAHQQEKINEGRNKKEIAFEG